MSLAFHKAQYAFFLAFDYVVAIGEVNVNRNGNWNKLFPLYEPSSMYAKIKVIPFSIQSYKGFKFQIYMFV